MKLKITLILTGLLSVLVLALSNEGVEKEQKYSNLRLTQIAGKTLFGLKNCGDCHTLGSEAEDGLTPVSNKRDDAWFTEHVTTESEVVLRDAKSKRRQKRVLKAETEALDDFLYQSKPEESQQITDMPSNILDGAYLTYQNNCLNCHAIAGAGKEVGPDLSSIADEHGDKEWLIKNLMDPQQFSAESPMPKFDKLPQEDLEKIADYLLTLKK